MSTLTERLAAVEAWVPPEGLSMRSRLRNDAVVVTLWHHPDHPGIRVNLTADVDEWLVLPLLDMAAIEAVGLCPVCRGHIAPAGPFGAALADATARFERAMATIGGEPVEVL